MAYTATNWVEGVTTLGPTNMNKIEAELVALDTAVTKVVPSARVYNSAPIAISNGAVTALTFDTEMWDTDTIHDTSVNTGRLTCKTAGTYLIVGGVEWQLNATNVRQVTIRQNGTNVFGAVAYLAPATLGCKQVVSTIYQLAVSDYVELCVFQDSGGSLNVAASAYWSPHFMMQRVG